MGFGLVVEKCRRDYSPLESVRGVEDDIKNQHARLITYYIEDYAYQRCRQKHKIVKDFDTDEDFITDDEALG